LKTTLGRSIRCYLKNKLKAKGLAGVAQVVEHLPSNKPKPYQLVLPPQFLEDTDEIIGSFF
jgi:hypothetical protein